MHLAVGTSFSIIIPTSLVSVFTHNKHKAVDKRIVKILWNICNIWSYISGTILAATLETKSLVLFFYYCLLARNLFIYFLRKNQKKLKITLVYFIE